MVRLPAKNHLSYILLYFSRIHELEKCLEKAAKSSGCREELAELVSPVVSLSRTAINTAYKLKCGSDCSSGDFLADSNSATTSTTTNIAVAKFAVFQQSLVVWVAFMIALSFG